VSRRTGFQFLWVYSFGFWPSPCKIVSFHISVPQSNVIAIVIDDGIVIVIALDCRQSYRNNLWHIWAAVYLGVNLGNWNQSLPFVGQPQSMNECYCIFHFPCTFRYVFPRFNRLTLIGIASFSWHPIELSLFFFHFFHCLQCVFN